MSLKSIKIGLMSSFVLFVLSACDPCRDLAEKICDCKESTEEDRRRCRAELNVAKGHRYFGKAQDLKICEDALKNCSCEELIKGQSTRCGLERDNIKN